MIKFKEYTRILQEDKYGGNSFEMLASLGFYPNKTYNFYDIVKKWYLDNTDLSPEEIDVTLQAKIQNAAKDSNPYFEKLDYDLNATIASPDDYFNELEYSPNREAAFDSANRKLYINPARNYANKDLLMKTILHELIHSIQIEPEQGLVKNIYNPDESIGSYDPDPDISSYKTSHLSKPAELDTLMGEVNRIVAKLQNVMIYPNDIESAENALRYVIDPNNNNKIPKEFQKNMGDLRDIISGQGRRSEQEQERIIKILAQRLSLLAKNEPNKRINSVA